MPKFYYAVWKGRETGIFESWDECNAQVSGIHGAQYKKFKSREEAEQALKRNYYGVINSIKRVTRTASDLEATLIGPPIPDSISVDAACDTKTYNVEYRGVYTKTGLEVFHNGVFREGTINLGEFLAIVHALGYCQKLKSTIPIYSDSTVAIRWVTQKYIGTNPEWRNETNERIFKLADKALNWLQNNEYPNKILKWETKAWGENPADFGRK